MFRQTHAPATRPIGRLGSSSARPRPARSDRRWRPDGVQALEGRALMAVFGLDPAFNSGQPIIAPAALTSPPSTNTNDAVAVQSDGKIVVAGLGATATDPATGSIPISVRRYNADGTLDSTFGTSGQAQVLIPPGSATGAMLAHSLVILPGGGILLDVNLSTTTSQRVQGSYITYYGSDVVALTANGTLDATFGTKGIASLTTAAPDFTSLVVQSDGKILLGGTASNPTATSTTNRTAALTRLDADGTVDSTFNGGAIRILANFAGNNGATLNAIDTSALGVTTAGKIKVVTDFQDGFSPDSLFGVVQLNADGTADTSYGTGGVTTSSNFFLGSPINAAEVLPSGQVVEVITVFDPGDTSSQLDLTRLNADGTADSSFAAASLDLSSVSSILVAPDGSVVVAGEGRFSSVGSSSTTLPLELIRVTSTGQRDTKFAPNGTVQINIPNAAANSPLTVDTPAGFLGAGVAANDLALTANGDLVVAGTASYSAMSIGTLASSSSFGSQSILALVKPVNPSAAATNDYDGDGRSDIAAELSTFGAFAYRTGAGDTVQPFGPTGAGQALPAPGDYDGDGKTDVAAYLPAYGVLAYRPSGGGADQLIRFGPAGLGAAIPVPGDYDGDGKADVALFVPSQALYLIDPSGGGAPYSVQFGAAGAGQSIPVPGDYDGSGHTELAVYLPAYGVLAYRPSGGGADQLTRFGPAGLGASIPVAGDYDGDGKADVALYLPSTGTFAIDPSGGGAPYAVQFGAAGTGASIPLSGDYNGDGETDLAVYLPAFSTFAYRPSVAGSPLLQAFRGVVEGDVLQVFGTGDATTVPAAALIDPTTGTTVEGEAAVSAQSLAGLVFYQPDAAETNAATKKPKS